MIFFFFFDCLVRYFMDWLIRLTHHLESVTCWIPSVKKINILFKNLFVFGKLTITNYIRLKKKLVELSFHKTLLFWFFNEAKPWSVKLPTSKYPNHLNINLLPFLSLRLLFFRKTLSPTLMPLLFRCPRS